MEYVDSWWVLLRQLVALDVALKAPEATTLRGVLNVRSTQPTQRGASGDEVAALEREMGRD